MPKLPDPLQLDRSTPQPNRGVVQIDSTAPARTGLAIAQQQQELAVREAQRLDELKVTDAETELLRQENELQAEYQQSKNGDVLNPDFHKNSQQKYGLAIQAASEKLYTGAQKARFQQIANRRKVAFDAQRTTYAMGEADRYDNVVFENRMNLDINNGAAAYKDPAALAASSLALEKDFTEHMVRRGLADPEVLTGQLQKVRSQFWGATIDRALADNDISTANTLFATSGRMLTDQQRAQYSNRLNSANSMELGTTIATQALQMEKEGKTPTEVELFLAGQAGTNKEAYNAAQTVLTNVRQAEAVQSKVAKGTVLESFSKAGANAKAMQTVMSSPEYQNLDPETRGTISNYMREQSEQAVARELQREDTAERRKARLLEQKYSSPEAMATFFKTITDPKLADKTVQELYSLAPEIGMSNVGQLLKAREEASKGAKAVTLDKDLVNSAMPDSWKKNSDEANKDAFEGYVKSATLKWQENNPGKVPTLEQQKTIIRSGLQEFTVRDKMFGFTYNSSKKAYESPISTGGTSEAEVKRGMIMEAAAKGITLSDTELDKAYRAWLDDQ